MAYKAHFKTALGQHEIVLDAKVAANYKVGYVCKFANDTLTATTTAPASGDYIIAQSDMTMGYGHVPVENRDYRYDDGVASSTSAKKVAVFKITDVNDIYSVTV